jgi:hypothetical protein
MVNSTDPARPVLCDCGVEIFFGTGKSGKRVPIVAEPNENGNIWIDDDGVAQYRSKSNAIPEGATTYRSHFADCPVADQYRSNAR